MSGWSVSEVVKCIKMAFSDGIIYEPSEKELGKYDEKPEEFLRFLYDKSERICEFYEKFDDFKMDLAKRYPVPELYRYGYDKPSLELPPSCEVRHMGIYKEEGGLVVISKRNFIMIFHNSFDTSKFKNVSKVMFKFWFDIFIHRIYDDLENTHEFLPAEHVYPMRELARIYKCPPPLLPRFIEEKYFLELRNYFHDDATFQVFHEHFKQYSKNRPVSQNQVLYSTIYYELVVGFETVLQIREVYKDAFEPSQNPIPIIRCFWSPNQNLGEDEEDQDRFYFEKEVLNAIKDVRKDLEVECETETEEERKLGLVHMMNQETFLDILEKYNIPMEELKIIKMEIHYCSKLFAVPIISSFGTFCKLSTDAFREVILYLIRNIQLFENIHENEFETVLEWIETNLADFLVASGKLYTIDVWRIEEIIEKAKKDLKKKSQEFIKIPLKDSYEKSDILEYIQQKHLNIDMQLAERLYGFENAENIYKKHEVYQILAACLEQKIMAGLDKIRAVYGVQHRYRNEFRYRQLVIRKLEENEFVEELMEKVANLANFTLAYFKIAEINPISKFEQLLETPNFRKNFDETQWIYLKNIIFQDSEKLKKFITTLEHLYEFEEYEGGDLMFSKREKYIGDSEAIRLMEMEEMERISEKSRQENSKLRSILEAIQGQLKELRMSKEDEKKLLQDEIRELREENRKKENDMKNLEKELKSAKNSKIEVERKLEKKENDLISAENSKKNLENQLEKAENERILAEKSKKTLENKLETSKKEKIAIENQLVSAEKSMKNLENQLETSKKEKIAMENRLVSTEKFQKNLEFQLEAAKKEKIAMENQLILAEKLKKNLEKAENEKIVMENRLVLAENSKKILEIQLEKAENQLILAETSNKTLEDELRMEKNSKIEIQNSLAATSTSTSQPNILKIQKLEAWFETGIKKMARISRNHKKLRNYERILRIPHEEIFSNLNKLLQKFPNNVEIFRARNQVFKSSDFSEKMDTLRGKVERIRGKLEGDFEEEEEDSFMKLMVKYEQWVEEYL